MSECSNSAAVCLIAGGVGGTVAAFVTCPLEVIKTRLQSSVAPFNQPAKHIFGVTNLNTSVGVITHQPTQPQGVGEVIRPQGILGCARHMVYTEGFRSLYKGLGPNLIGVAPARAVYFAVYAKATKSITGAGVSKDSPVVHMCSGATAGFVTQTLTSPIWFIKTRLQLSSQSRYSMMKCIRNTYRDEGFKGFYRGLSASYYGITETIIHFAIYERLKRLLRESRHFHSNVENSKNNIFDFIVAAGFSKSVASICAYPHEVARTRLRQEEHDGPRKYRSFFQTLNTVYIEEGRVGLYGGLGTQLVRQVPNSAVMFMVYETIVFYLCSNEND